ncbi:nucleotide kinase domain-containing protein [Magnetospirillum sulfuroxidans]|uniref:5-hmdU DNA kinase helical domain-containing protein n=1 Tax=Magnetospirillum sulfuroxidans TaxID=611300 RepID=A0ABS5IH71_9PROT|nr:nucleotide kinase domain-containing protein [Magnetospirillum sulfuroxidans]MBR9973783.1 hypothetical protein [Magnetospirillum sulfuroxidans]
MAVEIKNSVIDPMLPGLGPQPTPKLAPFFVGKVRLTPTEVYDSYWRFAALRQEAFFARIERPSTPPWTDDPIIRTFKFTNAYRAADRVSQYLIREVIYKGGQSVEDVFFRIILFKIFNKIETWEILTTHLGCISFADFDWRKASNVLDAAMLRNEKVYSAAYIMPSAKSAFGHDRKHSNHLSLLAKMMADKVPFRIQQSRSMQDAYEILLSYPSIGPFLAYQYVIDINYSAITSFSEDDFVVPGPGALSGVAKCFADLGGWEPSDVIRHVTDTQEREFERLGLMFRDLWGRRLHRIDCQNLFCEVDKYARIKHPEFSGQGGRTRIKQAFKPTNRPISFWFPPKWGINENIE